MSLASAVRPWMPSNRSWLTIAFSGARVGVDVEADVAGVDPRERGVARAGRRGLHTRLDDRVAGDHAPGGGIEDRAVRGVRERADQPVRGAHRELRVAVEGDHEPDRGEARRIADVARVAGLGVPAQEAVELLELAALALPAHEPLLARVPARAAVQQVERPDAILAVVAVECLERRARALEQRAVGGRDQRVDVVGQERELQLRIGVGEVVLLELVDHRVDVGGLAEQGRDDHQRAGVRRQAAGEVELG
ncbi:MAG: hypothetical protein K8W52_07075 [Deltaproteobacteria bacterium]|nr:hypothetical protein [Deltaproteobacteria bacterium]